MDSEGRTIISWIFWIGLLLLAHLGYVWAENVAVFLVWSLAAIVFIILFGLVNASRNGHKRRAALAIPFDTWAYIQVGVITSFFVVRGQFWTAGAALALMVFMIGVNGQIDKQREENNAGVLRPGERGH